MKKEWLFWFCLTVLGLAFLSLGSGSILKVEELVILGDRNIDCVEIQNKLAVFKGESLLNLNTNLVAENLMTDKRIAKVTIERGWPNQLKVRIEEKKPVFLLKSDKTWGLTEQGEILPVEKSHSLGAPVIQGVQRRNFKPYTKPVVPELRELFALYRSLKERSEQVLSLITEINVSRRGDLILTLVPGECQVYLGRGDYQRKIARLIEILNNEKDLISKIDLRFENLGLVRPQPASKG
jgi:cell division protein FtsQ